MTNSKDRFPKRGEVYYADLDPAVGSEQHGTRPVLVLSNDMGNKYSPTIIVAAITSWEHKKAKIPVHVHVEKGASLYEDSIVLLEQIRSIDKHRLKQKTGALDRQTMREVDKALKVSLNLF